MGYVSFREGIPLKIVFKKRKVYKIDIFIEKKTPFFLFSLHSLDLLAVCLPTFGSWDLTVSTSARRKVSQAETIVTNLGEEFSLELMLQCVVAIHFEYLFRWQFIGSYGEK